MSYDPGNDPDPAPDVRAAVEDRLTVEALPILEAYRRVGELRGIHAFWGEVQEGTNDGRVQEFAEAQRVRLVEELRVARQELAERRVNEERASTALMVLHDITAEG